jgi:hypothetical protein
MDSSEARTIVNTLVRAQCFALKQRRRERDYDFHAMDTPSTTSKPLMNI